MIDDHYTIKLRDGKYTVIRRFGQGLELLRHDEAWPGADDLRFCNVLIAAVERIQELEEAIKAVLDGTLNEHGGRRRDGVRSFGTGGSNIPLRAWEARLRDVLEQKP